MTLISGIHHITALASNPQANIDFYAGLLGLRLIKKTVNFDAPDVYHFYYGDETGSPGTILTFFPFPGIQPGRKGKGQLTVTSFSAPSSSISYWQKRLNQFKVPFTDPQRRFDETFIYFEDFDGLGLELVFNDQDLRRGFSYGNIPLEFSIKGFYGAALALEGYEKTAGLLTTQMDHKLIQEKGSRFRFSASGKVGDFVDIICSPDDLRGLGGSGTVHHIAFSTQDDKSHVEAREKLKNAGFNITPVIDREYFHSVYFREPGGILFEIATLNPGFLVDEEKARLGESLKLPPWQERNRKMIEDILPPVQVLTEPFKDA